MNIYLAAVIVTGFLLIWSIYKRLMDDRLRREFPPEPGCAHTWDKICDVIHPSYADMAAEKGREFTVFVAKNFTRRHELILVCTKCGAIEDLSSEITPEETDDPDTSYPMYYSSTTERQ